jgi:hypothetical protein
MADQNAQIFCENQQNQFSAKIVLQNFPRKFVIQTAVMELPHA